MGTGTRPLALISIHHEGLHLLSEQAQPATSNGMGTTYPRMPWIGMRTADIDGTSDISAASPIHRRESGRGDERRVAARTGSGLNPQNEPGRLTFIHRFGVRISGKSCQHDPAVRGRFPVLWV